MKPIDATKYLRQSKYLPDITPWCGVLLLILVLIPAVTSWNFGRSHVNLPEAKYAHSEPFPGSLTPVIFLKKNGEVYLNYKEVRNLKLLPTILIETMEEMESKSSKILFNVDAETPWGKVSEVMDLLRGTNIKVVGLITDSHEKQSILEYWNQQKTYREKGLREPASVK